MRTRQRPLGAVEVETNTGATFTGRPSDRIRPLSMVLVDQPLGQRFTPSQARRTALALLVAAHAADGLPVPEDLAAAMGRVLEAVDGPAVPAAAPTD